MLLEREAELTLLRDALTRVAAGGGHTVVVSGEAGIGKTALVRSFLKEASAAARVFRCACEDLSIAEPLAPLRDLARESGWDLPEGRAGQGDRLSVFSGALEILARQDQATVVVVEDLHWADDVTIDFLKFLARRIENRAVLLLMTARDDHREGRPQVRRIVGGLASDAVTRIELVPLSKAAVQRLSTNVRRNGDEVFKLSGGNAFYVTELLRGSNEALPLSVQDSVLVRADTLSKRAREVLDAVAIFPRQAEDWLVEAIFEGHATVVEEAITMGLLEKHGILLTFRHELVRRTIEGELSGYRRIALNQAALEHLIAQRPEQLVRQLHHAVAAGDETAIRRLAPGAAREALRLGALRQAAGFLKLALALDTGEDRTSLLQAYAWTQYQVGQLDEAIRAEQEALAVFVAQGDITNEGNSYRRLSRFHWVSADRSKARDFAQLAMRTLANQRGPELAMAQSTVSQLAMLDYDYEEATGPASSAIELAEEFDRPDILAHALNNLGMSCVWTNPDHGRSLLERSLQTAKEINSYDDVARAFINSAWYELYRLNFLRSIEISEQGCQFCLETDQDGNGAYQNGTIAWSLVQLGRYDAALERAQQTFSPDSVADTTIPHAFPSAIAMLWVSMRRGDDIGPEAMNFLRSFIAGMDELQRLEVYSEIIAERAWLELEDRQQAIELLESVLARAKDTSRAPYVMLWLHKLDPARAPAVSEYLLKPVALQIQGHWREAASAWAEKGAVFFEALALSEGDEEARLRAIDLLRQIGALVTLNAVRREMAADGIVVVSKGPRRSTLSNPKGLTNRQMDVLRALNEGLSNADIAKRLFVAPKTVVHHVSAILAKLEVDSRGEAAALARDAGWI
jgi:DNA-binding CsgD family transcriptional regulator